MTNEEMTLRVQAGEPGALEALWAQTKGLALHALRRYKPTAAVGREDLEQAAFLGVHAAAMRYDSARGVPFGAWMQFYVRNACRRALGLRTGRTPPAVLSLDVCPDEENGSAWEDLLEDEEAAFEERAVEAMDSAAVARDVRAAVDDLPDRQRAVVSALWLDGRQQNHLAQEMGVSYQRVQEIQRAAFARLRRHERLQAYKRPSSSLAAFRRTGTSCVEREALWRIEASEFQDIMIGGHDDVY